MSAGKTRPEVAFHLEPNESSRLNIVRRGAQSAAKVGRQATSPRMTRINADECRLTGTFSVSIPCEIGSAPGGCETLAARPSKRQTQLVPITLMRKKMKALLSLSSVCLLAAGCSAVPGDAALRSGHPSQAAKQYESEYRQGSVDAGLRYASMLSDGTGIPRDEEKAFCIWSDLANRNVPVAYHNLGVGYEYGKGTTKDLKKAEDAYRRAAEAGVLWSIFNLGTLYSNQIAQKDDDVEGLSLLLRAKRLSTGNSDAEKAIREDRLGHIAQIKARMTLSQIAQAEMSSNK
ncbi:MAG: sel1 repeat family protein [Verrucomicrobia bacterium]|nr:sel1 repeat family protein [Verrucomicrobiota bacterium]